MSECLCFNCSNDSGDGRCFVDNNNCGRQCADCIYDGPIINCNSFKSKFNKLEKPSDTITDLRAKLEAAKCCCNCVQPTNITNIYDTNIPCCSCENYSNHKYQDTNSTCQGKKTQIEQLYDHIAKITQECNEAQAQGAVLKKAVEWMKSIGEFFAYKAPEQIDAVKLVGAMHATAMDALQSTPEAGERTCNNCAFDKCLDASAKHFKGCKNWRSMEAQP